MQDFRNHGNAALVQEALCSVVPPRQCAEILDAAFAQHGGRLEWCDIDAVFMFVAVALKDSISDTLSDALAHTVCEHAIALLMTRGVLDIETPGSGAAPARTTLRPAQRGQTAGPTSAPVIVLQQAIKRRATQPYVAAVREPEGPPPATGLEFEKTSKG